MRRPCQESLSMEMLKRTCAKGTRKEPCVAGEREEWTCVADQQKKVTMWVM